jgi:hypothetical protein
LEINGIFIIQKKTNNSFPTATRSISA